MSIVTKTGDLGTTVLMYGRRVPKSHPRVETYGTVDELNAAIGVARAASKADLVREQLLSIQKDLVVVMGELATAVDDRPRYVQDGYALVTSDMTGKLEGLIQGIESAENSYHGWAMPGAGMASATLDMARTICRRAERLTCQLQESSQLRNGEIIIYLNRLSDLLWLLARGSEGEPERGGSRPAASREKASGLEK